MVINVAQTHGFTKKFCGHFMCDKCMVRCNFNT